MELQMQIEFVISIAVAIVSGLGTMIGIAATIVSKVTKMKADIQANVDKISSDVGSMTEYQKLESALAEVHQENAELKKQIKKLMSKINHIHCEEE